jgi:plasmid stabilization system protein ParE
LNRVQVRPEAATDVSEAVAWHEVQWPGLGIEFLLELDAAIERAAINPEAYAVQYNGARRVLLRRFPYSAYYLVEPDVIQIFGVLHQHRIPQSWQSRLS